MCGPFECDFCGDTPFHDPMTFAAMMAALGRPEPPDLLPEILAHVERHVAPYGSMLTDLATDPVPIDVLIVAPSPTRPFFLLVTVGMSALPILPPPDRDGDLVWTELALCLPSDWMFRRRDLNREKYGWPVGLLCEIGKFVHSEDEYLWYGCTYGYEPVRPLAGCVPFTSILATESRLLPEGFLEMEAKGGKRVDFLTLVPIHESELAFCAANGPAALEKRLAKAGVTEVVDTSRPSTCG